MAMPVGAHKKTGPPSKTDESSGSDDEPLPGATYEGWNVTHVEKHQFRSIPVKSEDHRPGVLASYNLFASPPVDYWPMKTMAVAWGPKAIENGAHMGDCAIDDARAMGVDKGNNDSGTKTDESAIKNAHDYAFEHNHLWFQTHQEDDIGEPLYIKSKDQMIGAVSKCIENPSEPGWYKMYGWMNGTRRINDVFVHNETSSYPVWICDCENRSQAEEKLGPPPMHAYGEPRMSDESAKGTATPSPTITPTPVGTQTLTPTPVESTVTRTATATPEATATSRKTSTTTSGGTSTTPAAGSGAGFGPIVSLIGLLSATLLLYRRRSK